MTRKSLQSRLTGTFLFLGAVLAVAAIARFTYPLQADGSPAYKVLFAAYEYLKDMSLLIATGGVAYLGNVFQRRSSFIDSLKEEWRDVLHAKSALLEFTHLEQPTMQQYFAAFNTLSETIDNMRTVYRNVGETRELVGLFPYEPLHDMRRALQTLSPQKQPSASEEQRKLVRDSVLQAFYSLRERFLEELDLETPTRPILNPGSRRYKRTGATLWAKSWDLTQRRRSHSSTHRDPAVDGLLDELYNREQATPKPWRDPVEPPVAAPAKS